MTEHTIELSGVKWTVREYDDTILAIGGYLLRSDIGWVWNVSRKNAPKLAQLIASHIDGSSFVTNCVKWEIIGTDIMCELSTSHTKKGEHGGRHFWLTPEDCGQLAELIWQVASDG